MDLDAVLTREFCDILEHRMSHALAQSSGPQQRYWCDGVLPPELSAGYSIEQIQQSRQLPARAWFGIGSTTTSFWLTIKLGPHAVEAIMRQQPLQNYVPSSDSDGWIMLDVEHKALIVQLL